MANINIPNLCGASPDLNGALDEINKLKEKLTANIDVDASALKADLETGLGDLQSAFDKLEVELPEVPNINFQAEVTSLINDIDKTTVEGLAAFNTKLASLKLDFGDTLSDKGIDFDSLIASAETKLASGGNVCDTVANLEIPAANSGSGVTTEEREERGSGTSITISETPKEIVSVLGKTSGNTFFTNATYKQSGRTFTTTQRDADNNLISYTELKVTYIVNLVKEKPIATKQASKDGEKEEPSIVTTNTASVEKNVQGKIQSLLKKIDMKGISGLATEKENAGIQAALAKLKDGSFKEQMQKDIAAAQEEQKKIWQDPLNYKRVVPPSSSSIDIPASTVKDAQDSGANITQISSESKTTREVKVTTTENRNNVTTTTTRTSSGSTITRPKTEKSTISTNGFATRKVQMEESFTTDASLGFEGFKLVDNISKGVELKKEPFSIEYVEGRVYEGEEHIASYLFDNEDRENSNMIAAFVKDSSPPKVAFIPDAQYALGISKINALFINYTVLEKIDPNFKG